MSALKPCPACGGEARLFEVPLFDGTGEYAVFVKCDAGRECGVSTGFGTKLEVLTRWNSLPRRDDKPKDDHEPGTVLAPFAYEFGNHMPARDDRRFRAAVAAMQGLLASGLDHGVAPAAIFHADALLAELAKEGA